MAMNNPPIDDLTAKMGGNKYKLSCIISKQAKLLEKRIPELLEKSDKKSITLASEDILNGLIVSSDDAEN